MKHMLTEVQLTAMIEEELNKALFDDIMSYTSTITIDEVFGLGNKAKMNTAIAKDVGGDKTAIQGKLTSYLTGAKAFLAKLGKAAVKDPKAAQVKANVQALASKFPAEFQKAQAAAMKGGKVALQGKPFRTVSQKGRHTRNIDILQNFLKTSLPPTNKQGLPLPPAVKQEFMNWIQNTLLARMFKTGLQLPKE